MASVQAMIEPTEEPPPAASPPTRRRALDRGSVLDALLALGLFGMGIGYVEVNQQLAAPFMAPPAQWLSIVLVGAGTLPVAFRRVAPLTALLVGVTGLTIARWTNVPEYQVTSIALFFLLIAAGRHGSVAGRTPARLVAVALLASALIRGLWVERNYIDAGIVTESAWLLAATIGVIFNIVFVAGGWAVGELTRRSAERSAELEATNAELAAAGDELARQAVVNERVRIAREIHDVVAHHVSIMGVQAGAARRVLTRNPEGATEALESIEHSSREAVRELQQLLAFLRGGEPSRPGPASVGTALPTGPPMVKEPLPGLDRLEELRAQVAAAGLAVRLRIEGEPIRLPPSLDLSAYRIVQEGLTNVRKHAHTEEADVTVGYGDEELTIVVADRGRGPVASGSPRQGGNGLTGIRERVSLHQGRLEAGPGPDGGFVLRVELPYRAALVGAGER